MVTWDEAEQVTLERWRDPRTDRDVFRVDKAPAAVVVHEDILREAMTEPRSPIRWEADGLVRWRFDNCRCSYRIVDHDAARRAYLCERLAAMGG